MSWWKSLEVGVLLFLQFAKTRLGFRIDFLVEIFSTLLVTVSGLYFISLLVRGNAQGSLGGWSHDEVLFLYGYSLIPTGLFNIVGPNLHRFSEKYVIEGQFDRVLLRPMSSLLQILCESFHMESIANLGIGGWVLWEASARLGLYWSFSGILWLFISAISGATILLSVFVFLASLSFHFEDRFGLTPPFYNLIMFGRYPLPIYHWSVQVFLTWIVPFGFVAFYPATHFLKGHSFEYLQWASPFIAICFFLIARKAWGFGVERYSGAGG